LSLSAEYFILCNDSETTVTIQLSARDFFT
jgi:hypothetical protein